MERGYKFRIYPNKEQRILLAKTFGCTRFIYNYFLNKRMHVYEEENRDLGYYECCKELIALKQELEWLKEPDKYALQNALRDLDAAYKRFFNKQAEYPTFKAKRSRRFKYRTSFSNNNIEFLGDKIKLPKLGKVRCRGYKEISGRILSATVSQAPSGKYYVSLCCTDVEFQQLPKTGKEIGIDLGLKEFAITSNGEKYANPKYFDCNLQKLKKLQRELSRKTKGGSNWNKCRIKIARLHEQITNQRIDYLHKLTAQIIRENDVICIETLRGQNMIKNHNLARQIADVSWYEFTRQLTYKAERYGKQVIKIDPFYASSQTCFVCGSKNSSVKNLAVRAWMCDECGNIHDRDENAAINVLLKGLEQIA